MQFRVGVVMFATMIIGGLLATLNSPLPTGWITGRGTYDIKIELPEAPGIGQGTPVRKSGLLIGKVHMIEDLDDRIVVHARHYAALPELVTSTDLLAIVPQMYAHALGARWRLRVWELPGHRPDYDVSMLWHASATGDAAHAWLRALVRRLFSRAPRPVPSGARR